ncbi:hypothetical protein PN586_15685, partial [Parabacteroides merdae]|uniref:hypothetical protein n=2 Tax=Parabacteroides merdae TaxID=46503 RepID=UPI001E324A02
KHLRSLSNADAKVVLYNISTKHFCNFFSPGCYLFTLTPEPLNVTTATSFISHFTTVYGYTE